MNDEIKPAIDAAFPEGSAPFTVDSGAVLDSSRRVRRRRRMFAGGGASLAVTACAAVLAASLAAPGDGTPDGAADEGEDQPEYTLPDLDPDAKYEWEMLGPEEKMEVTDSTWEYSAELRHHLDQEYPGWSNVPDEYADPDNPLSSAELHVARVDNHLREAVEKDEDSSVLEDTGHTQPLFSTVHETDGWDDGDDMGGGFGTTYELEFDGADGTDFFGLEIWPSGGYTDGEGGDLDLVNCIDEDFEGSTKVECDETEGPDGELVRTEKSTWTNPDGDVGRITNKIVFYRGDGVAIVVTDNVEGPDLGDRIGGLEGREPFLDFEELVDLAAALPGAAVE
ncbi:MAG: hypothetical protein ACRDXX_22480 [Stackebrandtia sp.]